MPENLNAAVEEPVDKAGTAEEQPEGKVSSKDPAEVDLTANAVCDDAAESDVRRLEVEPGTILKDRFLLLREIGKGGLSIVYKARDMVAAKAGLADPNVAIKIMRADARVDPDIISLMHREARRLRDLIHPNIVRVYDMDRQDDIHFMVMELLEGKTLSQLLREAPRNSLQRSQIDKLIDDLAAAVGHAHKNGIIHADLKPGNVFIQNSGDAKLIDFNIAHPIARPFKTREEDTIVILARLGAVTPAYASPQRLNGAEPCEADDVYSLAVIAYLALCGKRPYGKKNAQNAIDKGLTLERPKNLSSMRWKALSAGLALDDANRTPTIREFAQGFCRPNLFTSVAVSLKRAVGSQPHQPSTAGK